MKKSDSSSNILNDQLNQLPLPGFKMKMESPKPNFLFFIENKGDGRYRLHAIKKR